MQEYLLDTNILIYVFDKNSKVIRFLKNLKREYFFISTITYFEFIMGSKNEIEEQKLKRRLKELAPLDLRVATIFEAHEIQKKYPKKLKFKDLLIAATAQVEGLTLITADKNFKEIKGLKVSLVKI